MTLSNQQATTLPSSPSREYSPFIGPEAGSVLLKDPKTRFLTNRTQRTPQRKLLDDTLPSENDPRSNTQTSKTFQQKMRKIEVSCPVLEEVEEEELNDAAQDYPNATPTAAVPSISTTQERNQDRQSALVTILEEETEEELAATSALTHTPPSTPTTPTRTRKHLKSKAATAFSSTLQRLQSSPTETPDAITNLQQAQQHKADLEKSGITG